MNISKITRKFERLLFKGIPEQPEHNWERNNHVNANVSMRDTGKSQSNSFVTKKERMQKIGTYKYNHETQTETYKSDI
jgi:hypothetical protein